MHYKAPDNTLHFLADDSYSYLLPTGSVPITDAEAEAIRIAAIPLPTVQDKLNALDAANTLTQRNLRNTIQLMAEAFKQISGGTIDLSAIPGVAKVYEVEAQAAVLRSQL
jgi:hypothetical protein